jgi:hypothetical protein
MPRPRDEYRDGLPAAVLSVLVHGELPPNDGRERPGIVEAFVLKYDHHQPKVAAELRRLWARHADEITAATPPGATPWVVTALHSPEREDEED